MKEIRILLVDDHEIVRCGVRNMLGPAEDVEVVGDCASGEEALLQAEALSPNIVLMETDMPGMGGIEATRRYCQRRLPGSIIVLTLSKSRVAEAMEAGAVGYLFKDIDRQGLIQAIRRVYNGELVIDERFTLQGAEGGSECPPQGCDSSGTLIKEAELILLPPVNIAQLLRFTYQVEGVLDAAIVQQFGSRDNGTTITIRLRKVTSLVEILDRLVRMPDVEEVEDQSVARYAPANYSQKSMARIRLRPRKRFQVTLKSAVPVEPLGRASLRVG